MKHNAKLSAFFLRASKQFNVSKRTMYRWAKKVSSDCIRTEYERVKGMKLLKFKQEAEMYNCSRSSIYRWTTEEGKIPYVKICGRLLRIREEDALKAMKKFKEGDV